MKRFILALLICMTLTAPAIARTAWTRSQTAEQVRKAAAAYNVPRTWITRAAIDIIYIGAAESHGRYWLYNGIHAGILQFNTGWKQSAKDKARHRNHKYRVSDWRCCPQCSINRFVRSYKDGGKAAIQRHWKATLYR